MCTNFLIFSHILQHYPSKYAISVTDMHYPYKQSLSSLKYNLRDELINVHKINVTFYKPVDINYHDIVSFFLTRKCQKI